MKKFLAALHAVLLCSLLVSTVLPVVQAAPMTTPGIGLATSPLDTVGSVEYVPGRVLLKLTETTSSSMTTQNSARPAGLSNMRPLFPNIPPNSFAGKRLTAPDGTTYPTPDLSLWYAMDIDLQDDVMATVQSLRNTPGVAAAEPDYIRRLTGSPSALPGPSTDPLYSQQWHLGGAQVSQAWEYLQSRGLPPGGSRDVIVAVIDTGVDYTHPDLAANIWVNPAEFNGLSGVDDDANGYIDDIHGANVVTQSGNPMDDQGHGTHVAGIIAAQAGNNLGGVGVAYNVQVMPIKAAQYSGVLTASDIATAVYYAASKGADVINMSFGSYMRSQLEEDALATAYAQAVLVAAAGNDGLPNLPCDGGSNMYPAAYNWVLGVMASGRSGGRPGFSNFDCVPHDANEYEVMAPGVDIYSTLPGGMYAAWDGTSMSAPLISGMAALARTLWSDKDSYSSRFLMGQIASTGPQANAYLTLTTTPSPALDYLQSWLFDPIPLNAMNDADGIIDSGETIDLAVQIRNYWGRAEPVSVTLEPIAQGASVPDPYVTMITSTVLYGAVGSFTSADNGLVYNAQGAVTGVQNPFRFQVSADTPNDHQIPFRLTITAGNGLNPTDPSSPYTFTSRFNLVVQSGRELPRIISQDMTLSANYLWIVADATLIDGGVTVTVEPGARIQWGTPTPSSPYTTAPNPLIQVEGRLLIQGTADQPVELFPSQLVDPGLQWVKLYSLPGVAGEIQIQYARILNPRLGASNCGTNATIENNILDHVYFYGNLGCVHAAAISNSIFNGASSWIDLQTGNLSSSLLNTGLRMSDHQYLNYQVVDSVFLTNGLYSGTTFPFLALSSQSSCPLFNFSAPTVQDGKTYVLLSQPGEHSFSRAEQAAQVLGGHLADVEDAAENSFLAAYALANRTSANIFIGLTDAAEGSFAWTSGTPLTTSAWAPGFPYSYPGPDQVMLMDNGEWQNLPGDTYLNSQSILELPGAWTQTQLDARLAEIRDTLASVNSRVTRNAFLNRYWDLNPAHWLRIQSTGSSRTISQGVSGNYWGTTSTTLIDAAIIDTADNFNTPKAVYQPILTTPAESTYPFVASVRLSTSSKTDVTTVGAQQVTFTLTYNRDMDTTVQPQVTFGPATPYTDFTVQPSTGGWQDPRIWTGTALITPLTGDGSQYLRISGGRAANDTWLEGGNDIARFRFTVATSGTESMNLQASGGEGYVDLTWSQDDFDLLAGFNLYRATSASGPFTRINPVLLPPQARSLRDSAVVPGQAYYYRFTVVKTDLSESAPSNVNQAAPVDTIPPALTHVPVTAAGPGLPLTLSANATDNVGVTGVNLFFRSVGVSTYSTRSMLHTTGSSYSATLEGSLVTVAGLEYYLEASDGVSITRSGRADAPYRVLVDDQPVVNGVTPASGPASGGSQVTLTGSNFKAGATVIFGGAAASAVSVDSPNQITCTTPAHIPALVDIRVTNAEAQTGLLLNSYTFHSTAAALSLPTYTEARGKLVNVPIQAANLQGLLASSLTLQFDSAILRPRSVAIGSLASGWTLAANMATPGQVRLSLASPGGAVQGSGVLAVIEFEVIGEPGTNTTLVLSSISLNDGAIPADSHPGAIQVDWVYDVTGAVTYWSGAAPVPEVSFTLHGGTDHTGTSGVDGAFTVHAVPSGDYVLTPSKANDDRAITAYDAALVLQHTVGLISLTGPAAAAADVNQSGSITGMDAAYILQRAVGSLNVPFPGAGRVWQFTPAQRTISGLAADRADQDFTALLLGDPSGNWGVPSADRHAVSASTVSLTIQATPPNSAGDVDVTLRIDPGGFKVSGIDLELGFDPARITALEALLDPSVTDWILAANMANPGSIRLALASSQPLTEPKGLVRLRLHLNNPGSTARLQTLTGLFNEGSVAFALPGTQLGQAQIFIPQLHKP